MQRRSILSLVAVIASSTLVVGCEGETDRPRPAVAQIVDNFEWASAALWDTKPDSPYTIGDLILCLDGPGQARIDEVIMQDSFGEMTLDAYAVVPNELEITGRGFSDDGRSLADRGLLNNGGSMVSRQCAAEPLASPDPSREPASDALLLQFSRHGPKTGGHHGVTVKYTSGGQHRSIFYFYEFTLCAPDDQVTKGCAKPTS